MKAVPENLLNLNNDQINKAMVDGLVDAFKEELKTILREVAEQKVHEIANTIGERLRLKVSEGFNVTSMDRTIKLDWLLTKEK